MGPILPSDANQRSDVGTNFWDLSELGEASNQLVQVRPGEPMTRGGTIRTFGRWDALKTPGLPLTDARLRHHPIRWTLETQQGGFHLAQPVDLRFFAPLRPEFQTHWSSWSLYLKYPQLAAAAT